MALASEISPATAREIARWYKLRDHEVQLSLIHDVCRFKVVPAGRRSGKTERFKRHVVKQAMAHPGGRFFAAAPTRDQVKKIFWSDLKLLSLSSIHARRPSESDLIIHFDNDAEIHLVGLDQPARIEGVVWDGGGIDEMADVKGEAWESNIRPALDTFNPMRPDYRAWCWLFGVPDGLNHYYDLAEYARTAGDPDWKLYHWKSSDILPPDVIEAAKRQMSKKQYLQEYEASFETASGRIYDDYGPANWCEAVIEPHEQLLWMHDFNYSPMSSCIGVMRDAGVHLLEEIILTSAVARQSAEEFVERYASHRNKHVVIYGDPAGKAGEKHGQSSDYIEIEKVLNAHGWGFTRKIRPSTRSIKDGQNAVRAKIMNAAGEVSLFVNPSTAKYVHKALATGQLKKGSTFLEEDGEFQHVGTAVRYFIDYEFPTHGRDNRQLILKGAL
jgi:hypothetical protein